MAVNVGQIVPFSQPSASVEKCEVARHRRRRPLPAVPHQRQAAPADQQDHHHRGDLHDPQRVLARLVHPLRVAPPEVHGDQDRHERRRRVHRQRMKAAGPAQQIVGEPDDVLPRRHAADRPGQHVVEQQRRHRQLRQRPAHRLLDDAVHAAAHEHRGALDVHGTHGVREQHHAEDEPRRRLADRLLGDAADVERRRPEIAQDDRGGPPEGDEREEDGRRDDDADARVARRRSGVHTRLP